MAEDIRSYRVEEEQTRNEEQHREYDAAPEDDEVPFDIPRD